MKPNITIKTTNPKAQGHLTAMAITYFMGVFNDNFFKQAVLLLAIVVGASSLQGNATELFSLPFILFSAVGGWLADRFSKRNVVIGVKFLELLAMLIGAYGILTLNWNFVLSMIFLMGLQSTLFGPALNGAIPEIYPESQVTKANALLKLVTTIAILLGIAMAGFALDQEWLHTKIPFGRVLVALVCPLIAAIGVAASFGIHHRQAAGTPPFPWTGPVKSLKDSLSLKDDPPLLLAVLCEMFFYFISLLAILVINTLGLKQMALSQSTTSILSVAIMAGVCLGSFAAARLTTIGKWTHILGPGAAGMGLSMIIVGLITISNLEKPLPATITALTATGFFGGIFLIPVTSFIQVRPFPDQKGKIISAANFLSFSGMWLAGRLFMFLDSLFLPSSSLMLLGFTGCLTAMAITIAIPQLMKQSV